MLTLLTATVKIKDMNDAPTEEPIKQIFYFPFDAKTFTEGEPVPVTLKEDGSADLSQLPPELQDHLSNFGVRDPLHRSSISPKDGHLFLAMLLENSGRAFVFRASPEKL